MDTACLFLLSLLGHKHLFRENWLHLLLCPPLKQTRKWRDPGQLCMGPHRKEKDTDRMGQGCAYKSECRFLVGKEEFVKKGKKKSNPTGETPV